MKVSYNKLSELTGISYRTLKKRLDGLTPLPETGQNGANLWDSKEALRRIYALEATRVESGKLDYQAEKARLAKEQADGQELKNAQLRAELIPAEEVTQVWASHIINAKTKILGIPSKIAPVVMDLDNIREIEAAVKPLIKEVLEDLANSAVAVEEGGL